MVIKAKELKGRVDQILERSQWDKGMLVSILQDIQGEFNYLPRKTLEMVSRGLDIPLTQVYSVVTFFKSFNLQPRGRHIINVCLGTACHVRGGVKVLERIEQDLGIRRGETTKDLKYTLETVNCVGACALGPIVIIDGEYSGEMKVDKVKPLLERYG